MHVLERKKWKNVSDSLTKVKNFVPNYARLCRLVFRFDLYNCSKKTPDLILEMSYLKLVAYFITLFSERRKTVFLDLAGR